MKQRDVRFSYAARAVAAAAVVLMSAIAAAPVIAAQSSDEARTEARIKDMHSRLNITAAQEDKWAKVAAVMRDNAKKMDELTNARMAKAKTMTAVEDINSYGMITYAHADGIKRFAPVFAALYADMPDAQKGEADTLFRHGVHDGSKQKK